MKSANLPKNKIKSKWKKKLQSEKKLKVLDEQLDCNKAKDEYSICQKNLNLIYDEIA